ncbi:hypothetical protein KGY79_10780 [Candidatus Bipolaricaulota bacterium]|nr:hypothetical protein [Candidatus Bipolaricaulota bacterium]
MKKLSILILSVFVFTLAFSTFSYAGRRTNDAFVEEFVGSVSAEQWKIVSGDWAVDSGNLTGKGKILTDIKIEDDRLINFSLKANDQKEFTVFGKFSSEDNYVAITFLKEGPASLELVKEGQEVLKKEVETSVDISKFHNYKLKFSKNTLSVKIDGEAVLGLSDTNLSDLSGGVGFASNGEITCDNISIATFTPPVLVLSVGQSPGAVMAKVLAQQAGVTVKHLDKRIQPEELTDIQFSVLMPVIGASGKGLGSAGISIEKEVKWASDIFAKARSLDKSIITLHIEGEARRGDLSNKLIKECVPGSDFVIVKASGNKDGLFKELTDSNNVPFLEIENAPKLPVTLKDLIVFDEESS